MLRPLYSRFLHFTFWKPFQIGMRARHAIVRRHMLDGAPETNLDNIAYVQPKFGLLRGQPSAQANLVRPHGCAAGPGFLLRLRSDAMLIQR
jgi:hypothetical protein